MDKIEQEKQTKKLKELLAGGWENEDIIDYLEKFGNISQATIMDVYKKSNGIIEQKKMYEKFSALRSDIKDVDECKLGDDDEWGLQWYDEAMLEISKDLYDSVTKDFNNSKNGILEKANGEAIIGMSEALKMKKESEIKYYENEMKINLLRQRIHQAYDQNRKLIATNLEDELHELLNQNAEYKINQLYSNDAPQL